MHFSRRKVRGCLVSPFQRDKWGPLRAARNNGACLLLPDAPVAQSGTRGHPRLRSETSLRNCVPKCNLGTRSQKLFFLVCEGKLHTLLDLRSCGRNWRKNDLPGRERCRIGCRTSWRVVLLSLPCSFSCRPSSSPLDASASLVPLVPLVPLASLAPLVPSVSSTPWASSASFDALPMTLPIEVAWRGSYPDRRPFAEPDFHPPEENGFPHSYGFPEPIDRGEGIAKAPSTISP